MPKNAQTAEEKNRAAADFTHRIPAVTFFVGGLYAALYFFVDDKALFIVGTIIASWLFMNGFAKIGGLRHTAMPSCYRCEANRVNGREHRWYNKFFTRYCHRRITDSKLVHGVLAIGVLLSVPLLILDKPMAGLPYLIALEVFVIQYAMFFLSIRAHRAYQSSCPICAKTGGRDLFPYGKATVEELDD